MKHFCDSFYSYTQYNFLFFREIIFNFKITLYIRTLDIKYIIYEKLRKSA